MANSSQHPKSTQLQAAVSTQNKNGFSYSLTSFGKAFIEFASRATHPVVDIGAAYGIATLPALLSGAKVIAVDIEDKHLTAITNSIDSSLRERLTTLNARFPDFDLQSSSVSAVYMSQVLPFLKGEEIEEGARKIYDWLIPGGKIFVVSFTPYIDHVRSFIPVYEGRKKNGKRWAGYIENLSRFSDDANIYSHLPNEIHHIDADDLQWAFENAGFELDKISIFGEEEGELPPGIRMDGRERVGMIATKPKSVTDSSITTTWRDLQGTNSKLIPATLRGWLYKPFVLSQALRRVCVNFSVHSVQSFRLLHKDEIDVLKCTVSPYGYVRETYLGEPGNPLVYARVTMDYSTYLTYREDLDNLGNRPIGETLLYKDPTLTRSEFEIKRITQNDELLFDALVHENFYRAAIEKKANVPELWGRRSVFTVSGHSLLITEIFLATIPEYRE